MKRIVLVMVSILFSLSLVGCGNEGKQEELLQYLNNDIVEMVSIETELLESYGSVTGDNYTGDTTTYSEFTTNTYVLARELNDMAVEISKNIKDKEILKVHRLYMDYSNKFLSTIGVMITAIENQDIAQMSEANEKLNEANNLALDYQIELNDLVDKYNVAI